MSQKHEGTPIPWPPRAGLDRDRAYGPGDGGYGQRYAPHQQQASDAPPYARNQIWSRDISDKFACPPGHRVILRGPRIFHVVQGDEPTEKIWVFHHRDEVEAFLANPPPR